MLMSGLLHRLCRVARRGRTVNMSAAARPMSSVPWSLRQDDILLSPRPDRSAAEFAPVACQLVQKYPDATTIHLVVDNLNIHRRKSLTDYYGETAGNQIWDRFTVHYTPTHASWLNQAEIAISLFARQCLGKRRIPDLKTLQRETRAWNRRVNRDRVRINWRFDRKMARRKFGYKKYYFKRSRD
jgi:transposase